MAHSRPTRLSAKIASLTLAGVLLGRIACSGTSSGSTSGLRVERLVSQQPGALLQRRRAVPELPRRSKCGAAFETYFACAATQEEVHRRRHHRRRGDDWRPSEPTAPAKRLPTKSLLGQHHTHRARVWVHGRSVLHERRALRVHGLLRSRDRQVPRSG